ncbi:hypothetical protein E6W36_05030 [Hankyongella ginsenosidimutans]|uniref:DUF5681 domain-containing protein n=1 Tax=Hankyongella ginsenosidimutans TaxID=1763828 RepID=A0A4D7CBU3_9SPHN|nr:hypothetical protein E6W36_05030 [Hankyongella ginsenosidimutans]
MTVTENGRRRAMSKLELVFSQLINKAASGNEKNFKLFLEMMNRFPPEAATVRLDRDDQEFLQNFLRVAKEIDDKY